MLKTSQQYTSTVSSQPASRTRYSNLFDHVRKNHTDFYSVGWTGSAVIFLFRDVRTLLSQSTPTWIAFRRRHCIKDAGLVVRQLVINIGVVLHGKTGIIFDGQTFQSEHYLAVFAVFESKGRADKMENDTTDYTFVSHVKLSEGILPFFDR
ncbi:hypothetical protein PHMEG_00010232 [Phytophthora megakarya]|uniref:Uncharacterized protein n=1 Tax=Phytophthora megakarya TaxID=4795 RepID=A0A225WFJ6_9STRA|nr:hypothetical protein PHMEG_00010232 [Phytophthora megakarya]